MKHNIYIGLLILTGCALTPIEPVDPAIETPAGWTAATESQTMAWPSPDWWRNFSSEELNQLISQAQAANFDIAAAASRVVQAEARARIAGAPLLPSVDLGANAGRSGTFGEGGSGSVGVSLGASYEVDFWGSNRAAQFSASAALQASEFDKATVALTVTSGVANTYLNALSLRDRLAVARANLEIAERVLALVEAKVRFGAVSQLDLAQQRSAVASQRAAIPPLLQQEREARAALALLLGRLPQGFDVKAQGLDIVTLPELTAGLPSELLTRRPDLRSAERDLVSAQADIVIARAALLPSLRLSASTGVNGSSFAALFDNNPVYSLAAALSQPIFNAGQLEAQEDLARARREELLQSYRNAIITAFSEVDMALSDLENLRTQAELQAEVVKQAEISLQLAETRYRAGAEDLLTVLDAQRTLYQARDNQAQLRLARLQAVITLYRVLGGGWDSPPSAPDARAL
jgi:NodT family efflux transporter outer membrane factor (OMF) lipoprotein